MNSTPRPIVIEHVTLIDGTLAPPVQDATVTLREGRVAAIEAGADDAPAADAEVVDGRGKWLIPGLADAHVHVALAAGEPALRHWLAWGVTTVRDLGGDPAVVFDLRERERRGEIAGSRVVAHGPFLDGDPPIFGGRRLPGLGDIGDSVRVLRTVEDVDAAVDQLLELGVDGFKLYAGLRPELVERAVRRVDGRVPVNAHLGRTWASEAAAAGVDCLEHVHASVYQDIARPEDRHTREGGNGAMPNYWTWLSEGWARADLDAPHVHRFIELLVERNVYLSPTTDLLGPGGLAGAPVEGPDPDREWAPRAQRERWEEQVRMMERLREGNAAAAPAPQPDPAIGAEALAQELRFLGMFHAAGGKLLAGTDTGVIRLIPGVALHNELHFLARAGVDPLTVVHIATQRAAEAMRADADRGSLTVGRRADAVLLGADPLADIRNTRRVERVVKDGVSYRPDDLWER